MQTKIINDTKFVFNEDYSGPVTVHNLTTGATVKVPMDDVVQFMAGMLIKIIEDVENGK